VRQCANVPRRVQRPGMRHNRIVPTTEVENHEAEMLRAYAETSRRLRERPLARPRRGNLG